MNGKDGLENKDQAKGFVMFLLSEKQRHKNDIVMIAEIVSEVCDKWKITNEELWALEKESEKYVEF